MRRIACVSAVMLLMMRPATEAQSRRAPTPAEAAVLTTFLNVLRPMLDQFADENWEKTEDSFNGIQNETIAMHASVPLDDCIGVFQTYQVRPDSPRFNTLLKPMYLRAQELVQTLTPKIQAGTATDADMKEIRDIDIRRKQLTEIKVDACGNSPTMPADELLPDTPSLLDGVVVHKPTLDACGSDTIPCYVLVYGDWRTATYDRGARLYNFRFVHPPASPFLENIVVTIRGADDRIQELLKQIDWRKLNDAFTR